MDKFLDYMPHIEHDGRTLELCDIGICMDFGGRQYDCEFQYRENGKFQTVRHSYYPLTNEWSNGMDTQNKLTVALYNLYAVFDTTGKLDVKP